MPSYYYEDNDTLVIDLSQLELDEIKPIIADVSEAYLKANLSPQNITTQVHISEQYNHI